MDFAVRGHYTSVDNSNMLKIGAVNDGTSQTQVYALHDTNFRIT